MDFLTYVPSSLSKRSPDISTAILSPPHFFQHPSPFKVSPAEILVYSKGKHNPLHLCLGSTFITSGSSLALKAKRGTVKRFKLQSEKAFLMTALSLICTVPTNIKNVLPWIFVFVGGMERVLWDVCVCDHQVAVVPFLSFLQCLHRQKHDSY